MGISHCLKTGNSILQSVNNSALQGGSSLIKAPTVSYVSWNSQKSPGPFSNLFIVKCVLHKPVIKAQALWERFYIVWPLFWPTNAGRLMVNDHQLSFLRILNPQVSLLESPHKHIIMHLSACFRQRILALIHDVCTTLCAKFCYFCILHLDKWAKTFW